MSTLFITHDVDEAILLSDRIYIMKGSPAAMTDELRIPTPRPRDRDYMLSEEENARLPALSDFRPKSFDTSARFLYNHVIRAKARKYAESS